MTDVIRFIIPVLGGIVVAIILTTAVHVQPSTERMVWTCWPVIGALFGYSWSLAYERKRERQERERWRR